MCGALIPLDADYPPPCSVSEFLMGEVDSSTLLSVPPGDPSQVSWGGLLSLGVVMVSCRVGIRQDLAQGWTHLGFPLHSPWRTCMDRGVRAPPLALRTVTPVSL